MKKHGGRAAGFPQQRTGITHNPLPRSGCTRWRARTHATIPVPTGERLPPLQKQSASIMQMDLSFTDAVSVPVPEDRDHGKVALQAQRSAGVVRTRSMRTCARQTHNHSIDLGGDGPSYLSSHESPA